jgi:hypothetical protein
MIESGHRTSGFLLLVVFAMMLMTGAQAQDASKRTVQEDANLQSNEFLERLAVKKESPGECYSLLKRRLLEGHFEDVKAGLDIRDASGKSVFTGYRFARLRARCARAVFLRYARQASSLGQDRENMLHLACDATKAYEEAFRLADSDFERACVYARWHELHANTLFEADSLLLRSGSPLEHSDKPISKTLSNQMSLLRSKVSTTLDLVTVSGKSLGQEAREAFVGVFVEEYLKLAKIGVPGVVYSEFLEDIEVFLPKAIHPRVLTNPKKLHMTIRYHIWYALTGYRPDEIDNEFIDEKIKTVDEYICEKISKLLPEYEDDVSKIFLELVELERDNRFIPGIKQPLWAYEWSKISHKDANSIEDEIIVEIDKGIAMLIENKDQLESQRSRISSMSRFGTPEDYEKKMARHDMMSQKETALSIRLFAQNLISELNVFQRVQHGQHPPSVRVTNSSGTVHDDSGIWICTVEKSEPVPRYSQGKSDCK